VQDIMIIIEEETTTNMAINHDDPNCDVALDQSNVFVKFLPPSTGDEGLRLLFSSFGTIISAKVMINHQTKDSLGYGYAITVLCIVGAFS
jgi:RNA recognition motif-containing protein